VYPGSQITEQNTKAFAVKVLYRKIAQPTILITSRDGNYVMITLATPTGMIHGVVIGLDTALTGITGFGPPIQTPNI